MAQFMPKTLNCVDLRGHSAPTNGRACSHAHEPLQIKDALMAPAPDAVVGLVAAHINGTAYHINSFR
jgi:hypothetical protein